MTFLPEELSLISSAFMCACMHGLSDFLFILEWTGFLFLVFWNAAVETLILILKESLTFVVIFLPSIIMVLCSFGVFSV